jgi:hypothetical protein
VCLGVRCLGVRCLGVRVCARLCGSLSWTNGRIGTTRRQQCRHGTACRHAQSHTRIHTHSTLSHRRTHEDARKDARTHSCFHKIHSYRPPAHERTHALTHSHVHPCGHVRSVCADAPELCSTRGNGLSGNGLSGTLQHAVMVSPEVAEYIQRHAPRPSCPPPSLSFSPFAPARSSRYSQYPCRAASVRPLPSVLPVLFGTPSTLGTPVPLPGRFRPPAPLGFFAAVLMNTLPWGTPAGYSGVL